MFRLELLGKHLYFQLEGSGLMRRNFFTILSAFFLILTIIAYEGLFNDFFLNISPYSLAVFGILGLMCAIFGIKGPVRISFIIMHSLTLVIFIFILLIAVFGFKEP